MSPSQLFGTLMILKAACLHNTCYIDRLITSFMRVLQRMAREHLTPTQQETSSGEEEIAVLLLLCTVSYIDGLVQERHNSSTLAMKIRLSCTNPSIYFLASIYFFYISTMYIYLSLNSSVASELLILSLDLVKNRVGVMSIDMRKGFIGAILVGLIEKTSDSKVMKAITKMVEDWVRTKVSRHYRLWHPMNHLQCHVISYTGICV